MGPAEAHAGSAMTIAPPIVSLAASRLAARL
jgi:hypothetical protein